MNSFLKAIVLSISYVVGVALIYIIKKYNKTIVKLTIGKIGLYGTRKVVDEYALAIKEELLQYDPDLARTIVNGGICFDIIYQDILHSNINDIPEARTFFSPQWIADYGVEGTCQHIAYCAIVMKGTSVGLVAAINTLDREKRMSECRKAMKSWIIEKQFPRKWISLYEENVVTNASKVPTQQ